MSDYIREVLAEQYEIVNNINQAFINGEFDDFPDPMAERDILISQCLLHTKLTPEKEFSHEGN